MHAHPKLAPECDNKLCNIVGTVQKQCSERERGATRTHRAASVDNLLQRLVEGTEVHSCSGFVPAAQILRWTDDDNVVRYPSCDEYRNMIGVAS